MINSELRNEIGYIFRRSLILDVAAVIISLFFVPWFTALSSILAGTLLLMLEMTMLAVSVRKIAAGARRGKNGSVQMAFYYLLRICVIAAVLYAAVRIPFLNMICTAIPLFYPKLIYFGQSIFVKKGGIDKCMDQQR